MSESYSVTFQLLIMILLRERMRFSSEEASVAKLLTFAYRFDMRNEKLASADSVLALSLLLARYFAGEATVNEIAKEAKLSPRTIWRKLLAVDTRGLKGLHRASRSDKGKRRSLSAELQEVIEGLFLKTPKPTVTWVWEQVVVACEKNKVKAPSYSLVAQVCRRLDRRLKVLAHDSEEAYEKSSIKFSVGKQRGQTRCGRLIIRSWISGQLMNSVGPERSG